jgi:predicted ester cyclase
VSAKKNKEAVRRVIEEAFNKGNLTVVDGVMSAEYVYHSSLGDAKGPDGFKKTVNMFRAAFPDIHSIIEDIVAEGDKVATRATLRGTHKGEFMGIAPTGKNINVAVSGLVRFAGEKEVEAWGNMDMLAVYQQLGVIPPVGKSKV